MKRNMNINATPRIFRNAKELRKHMTPAEGLLWEHLRDRRMEGEKFRRQHSIKKFVLDFYCYRLRLGIELDGNHHFKSDQQFYDNDRSEILGGYHLHLLRFANDDVLQTTDVVLDKIRQQIIELRS
ncbi:MAG: endonuclease domain-containing protein [Saprospiraceae bacterium]